MRDESLRERVSDGISPLERPPESIPPSCYHEGHCHESDNCICRQQYTACSRLCLCPPGCLIKQTGCSCPTRCKSSCPCRNLGVECDAELCSDCTDCCNMAIQRRKWKRVVVKRSCVAGWGCFAAETISKDELIMEYCGERISQEESERRGYWYDLKRSNFLFNLDDRKPSHGLPRCSSRTIESVIDATFYGTAVRFCNHSTRGNAIAQSMVVVASFNAQ